MFLGKKKTDLNNSRRIYNSVCSVHVGCLNNKEGVLHRFSPNYNTTRQPRVLLSFTATQNISFTFSRPAERETNEVHSGWDLSRATLVEMKLQAKTLDDWGRAQQKSGDVTWRRTASFERRVTAKWEISHVFMVSHLRLLSALLNDDWNKSSQGVWRDYLIICADAATSIWFGLSASYTLSRFEPFSFPWHHLLSAPVFACLPCS